MFYSQLALPLLSSQFLPYKSKNQLIEKFESIINQLMMEKVGVINDFLNPILCNELIQNIHLLNNASLLNNANIGSGENTQNNILVRKNSIAWLDEKHEIASENEFLNLITDFIKYLNMTCYTGIVSSEFHYSMYEPGDFYAKHYDQFKNNNQRKYTFISYLNEAWEEKDGGELLIHHAHLQQNISPEIGKTVVFESEGLLHEVLATNKLRLSVTGWLKV